MMQKSLKMNHSKLNYVKYESTGINGITAIWGKDGPNSFEA